MDPSNNNPSDKHINPPQQYEMKPKLNEIQNNKEDEIIDPVVYSVILANAEKHPKKYTSNFCYCNCGNDDCFLFGIFNWLRYNILCNSCIDLRHGCCNDLYNGCCGVCSDCCGCDCCGCDCNRCVCSVFTCSDCNCGGCDCGGCDCGGCDCGGCDCGGCNF